MITEGTKKRRVDTRMYGDVAFNILDRMAGSLGKYIWYVDVRRGVDDMTYLELSEEKIDCPDRYTPQNPFAGKDGAQALSWFGDRLKRAASEEAEFRGWKDGWWSRTNKDRLEWLSGGGRDVTVADVYEVYDELKGRTKSADDPRIFGEAAPPETVRDRVRDRKAKAEAKEKARAEYLKGLERIRRLEEAFRKKTQARRDALWRKFYAKTLKIDPDDKQYAFAASARA